MLKFSLKVNSMNKVCSVLCSHHVLARWLTDFTLNWHDTEYKDIKLSPLLLSLGNTRTQPLFY